MVSFGPAYEPLVVTENDLIVATMVRELFPHEILEELTTNDMRLDSFTHGRCASFPSTPSPHSYVAPFLQLGFGYFVGLHCVREFRRSKRWISPYLALIWAEFFACVSLARRPRGVPDRAFPLPPRIGISRCIIYGTICWLYLHGIIPPGFGIFFATTTYVRLLRNSVAPALTGKSASGPCRFNASSKSYVTALECFYRTTDHAYAFLGFRR